jgi:flagellar FliJ protein
MGFTYKFQRILTLREREKDEAIIAYEKAVRKFEEVAEKLYRLLKKKETLEEDRLNKIQRGLSVQELRLHQEFIANLEGEINIVQQAVIRARQAMQYEQKRILAKNIEVKKLEILKEKEYEKYIHLLAKEEEKQLDEIASKKVARGD